MATVLSPPEQRVILENVSWQTYEHLLNDLADRSAPRLTYDRGTLEIMSPTPKHEELNRNLALIVTFIAAARKINVRNLGSTTFRREDAGRGFEPDSCFYIEHEARVRGKERIDLRIDPPPDLIIEIDITSGSRKRFPIYAQLGVPEIWRYDKDHLIIYRLGTGGYESTALSQAFDQVQAAEVEAQLNLSLDLPSSEWLAALQNWVNQKAQ